MIDRGDDANRPIGNTVIRLLEVIRPVRETLVLGKRSHEDENFVNIGIQERYTGIQEHTLLKDDETGDLLIVGMKTTIMSEYPSLFAFFLYNFILI